MKEIIKNSGLYSGLTPSVKEIITPYTDNWKDCELELHTGSRPGWFIIEGILDERSNRQWLVSKQSYIGALESFKVIIYFCPLQQGRHELSKLLLWGLTFGPCIEFKPKPTKHVLETSVEQTREIVTLSVLREPDV